MPDRRDVLTDILFLNVITLFIRCNSIDL